MYSALDVAARYFRSGADKVSIGSDAVLAAEGFYARGGVCDGSTALEEISSVYGKQAVVVSVDPRRVWVGKGSEEEREAEKMGHVLLTPPPLASCKNGGGGGGDDWDGGGVYKRRGGVGISAP